jgi:hypothetical protein
MAHLSAVDGMEDLIESMDLTPEQRAAVCTFARTHSREQAEADFMRRTDPDGFAKQLTDRARAVGSSRFRNHITQ